MRSKCGAKKRKVRWSGWSFWGRFKPIHGTLILGVLPRNTPERPTRPSNFPCHIIFLSSDIREQGQKKNYSDSNSGFIFSLSFDLVFDFPLPVRNLMSLRRW
ncbi:MAG: hypothetical protein OQL19_21300 [Gammaproteobacteria bacterium]|nr:hypothetical protein [Gammaproteobacteria bacterium]